MKSLAAPLIALLLASCATSEPIARAEAYCGSLARGNGLAVMQVENVEPAGNGHRVSMRVSDRFNRRVNATCLFENAQARWDAPLPKGLITR